jgi:hypothetical protein
MDLFRARGWTTIITNNLVGYVLSYTTFTVGVTSGLIGIGLERLMTNRTLRPDDAESYSFAFGSLPYPAAWAFVYVYCARLWHILDRIQRRCCLHLHPTSHASLHFQCCIHYRDMGVRDYDERTYPA